MNTKGQAALEYLMTYGWALIVIAIVVGVLIFIVSSPTSGVTCNSSDPAKILFKSSNILGTAATSEIQLQNATGGNITITAVSADGTQFGTTGATINGTTAAPSGMTLAISSGQTMKVVPGTYGAGAGPAKTLSGARFGIQYTDQFNYTKDVNVTCNGKIA